VISRVELLDFLDNYLACSTFNDYAPNGLQVEGQSSIKTICTAVTASQAIIERAAALKADALIVHHGFFWRGEDPVITGMKRQRVGQIITHNLNLFAYHLPLDCHVDVGNNACISRALGAQDISSHLAGKTPNLLWTGQLKKPTSIDLFSAHLADIFKRTPIHISGTNKPISRIAWCSGAAQDFIEDAHRLGANTYISGEISERTYYQAQELGMHYFACGHHATERFGIQALGEFLSQKFDLTHQFLDSDNPV